MKNNTNFVFTIQGQYAKSVFIISWAGRNIQRGYMQIFAGAMIGIRNPKAHKNITIGRERGFISFI